VDNMGIPRDSVNKGSPKAKGRKADSATCADKQGT
jgi:hypothetical protein